MKSVRQTGPDLRASRAKLALLEEAEDALHRLTDEWIDTCLLDMTWDPGPEDAHPDAPRLPKVVVTPWDALEIVRGLRQAAENRLRERESREVVGGGRHVRLVR